VIDRKGPLEAIRGLSAAPCYDAGRQVELRVVGDTVGISTGGTDHQDPSGQTQPEQGPRRLRQPPGKANRINAAS